MARLDRKFFDQSTMKIARALLGATLVRKMPNGCLRGRIVETEAYMGPNDLASHASRGKTPRTQVMFGPPGHAYIYLVYGMYYCLNIVTERLGFPAAVLIRALEPLSGIQEMARNRNLSEELFHEPVQTNLLKLTSGPGKLCQALSIDKSLNDEDIVQSKKLYIESGEPVNRSEIASARRIGVDYAGKFKDKEWRFYLKNNSFVSKK